VRFTAFGKNFIDAVTYLDVDSPRVINRQVFELSETRV
jgi:hypothetical protein